MADNTTPYTLDYAMCTPSELRDFIRKRRNLNAAESDALRDYHKSHLVACLQSLDRNATFRFGDLEPKLRLEIYRHILVSQNHEAQHPTGRGIETAILRTCKVVYAEAEPVLYGDNNFAVAIIVNSDENSWDNGGDSSVCNHFHYISISTPAQSQFYLFSEEFEEHNYPALSDHMASTSAFDMLRRVRHLDVYIGECLLGAQEFIAALSMMLSGTIQLKSLTLVILPSHAAVGKSEPAKLFWPLAFVNTGIKFACATQDMALRDEMDEAIMGVCSESEGYWTLIQSYPHRGFEAPGDLVTKARARAADLTKQHNRDWRYLRNIDLMMGEVVRCLCNIGTYVQVCEFVEAWEVLGSYVHEDDHTLRSLEKMAKDAPRTFPDRYADYKRRGMITGGWAMMMGLGGWD